jgi:hypothetical protein
VANKFSYQNVLKRLQTVQGVEDQKILTEADLYRQALAKGAYGEAGRGLSSGLQGISGYLSSRGPLADSGAGAALSSRLAGGLYGQASNQVAGGYAQYLAKAMNARRQYQYQLALLKAQQKAQQTGFGGVVGGIAGAALGGPLGGYLGSKLWGGIGGGGGGGRYQASDAYYS